MIKLLTALVTQFDSDDGAALKALAKGGIHNGQAPKGTKVPYITMNIVGDPTMPTMTSYNENPDLQFSIFVDDYQLDAAYAIRAALIALYDDFKPIFADGGHVFGVLRISGGMPQKDPDIGYSIVIQYKYWFDEA